MINAKVSYLVKFLISSIGDALRLALTLALSKPSRLNVKSWMKSEISKNLDLQEESSTKRARCDKIHYLLSNIIK